MSKKNEIPENIVANVEFLSDRTCCICRIPNKGTQIHHIDENRSNNDMENLAVLCLECHNKTQTRGGFVRQLSSDVVKEYNKSWRNIVKSKLLPNGDPNTFGEYKREVYLEISLTCHSWKNRYIYLYPGRFMERDGSEYLDIWQKMAKTGKHVYSEAEWRKYLPLFDEAIKELIMKFQSVIMMYSDAIAPEIKTLLIRTIRQLEIERFAYLSFSSISILTRDKNQDQGFNVGFSEVIRQLSYLSRKADEMREMD